MSRSVHFLVFDGFADWEAAYALAELRRSGQRSVVITGLDNAPASSMGGLRVSPDCGLADVRPENVEIFILPGGDLWERAYPREALEALLHELIIAHVPIAAICGATLALARAGVLDDRRHTSNMPGYLQEHAPEYQGFRNYDPALAVTDRGVITASGLGPVEFARAIFEQVSIFSKSDEELWFNTFKHGRLPDTAV